MNVTILPKLLSGTIRPPASKSQAHRLIIAAALAEGKSTISHVNNSQDITATLRCMEALGAGYSWLDDTTVTVTGIAHSGSAPKGEMDCGESGSTLRFLIPVALAAAGQGTFRGHGRLMERPQEPYFQIFEEKGIHWEKGDGTLTVSGQLTPGTYSLRGDISSQFITGLLYSLPLLEGDSDIVLTTALESSGYIDMTIQALRHFGVTVSRTKQGWHVPGNQKYLAADGSVEADWSQAGFWYAAQGIGNDITVTGMDPNSAQGDRVILEWGRMLRNEPMEGGITVPVLGSGPSENTSTASSGCGVSIDVSHSPDLVPPLAVWGALMNGTLHIKNAARLRIKESDRLATVAEVLHAMGAEITEGADDLIIVGQPSLSGGVTVSAHNDHRIAMMAAIAATRCRKKVTILGAECVRKSYPGFWDDYAALGGTLEVWE